MVKNYFIGQIHPRSKHVHKSEMRPADQVENYSTEEMNRSNLRGCPVSVEHGYEGGSPYDIEIGRIEASFLDGDGNWMVAYYIDDSTPDGRDAMSLYNKGLLPELSLSHLVGVFSDENGVVIKTGEKSAKEVSVVERGRRPGSKVVAGPVRYSASMKSMQKTTQVSNAILHLADLVSASSVLDIYRDTPNLGKMFK